MASDAVTLAYLHEDEVSHSFHESLTASLMVDVSGPQRLMRGKYLAQFCGSTGPEHGRNVTVKEWLWSGNYDAPWLLWVDSDMGWAPDAIERLMAVAHPTERPIVGGLCFGQRPVTNNDGMFGRLYAEFPTVYDIGETDEKAGVVPRYGYPGNTVQQVAATGSAFVVIHRDVLEAVADKFGPNWYTRLPHPKNEWPMGEDVSFCLRATACGFPIFVDTSVKTNHYKRTYLSEQTYLAQLVAPPATETTAVIVPVLGRPERAAPFMASLRASTGMAECYAVCSNDEDEQAWIEAGAHTIRTSRTTFACKVNDAADKLGDAFPWLFLAGDDVRFHAGWLDHAQETARTTGAKVVATNDLLNAAVLAGQHGTHVLVSTAYIAEQGASWDGPGKAVCEQYKHWYCDNEWTLVAQQRGVFASALGSVVEHLHPHGGKAKTDATYELGQKFANLDRETWEKRYRKYGQVAA